MPIDFPTTKPNVIAAISRPCSWNTPADQTTPALANAKIGSTT